MDAMIYETKTSSSNRNSFDMANNIKLQAARKNKLRKFGGPSEILAGNYEFPQLIFFRSLFFSAAYFYCGRPSPPAAGLFGGCRAACTGRIPLWARISAAYFSRSLFSRSFFLFLPTLGFWPSRRADFRSLGPIKN